MVTSAGVGTPGWIFAVLALNSLQKSMLLTPLLPSAGPTGGLGLACPAPTINFTNWLFLARTLRDMAAAVVFRISLGTLSSYHRLCANGLKSDSAMIVATSWADVIQAVTY